MSRTPFSASRPRRGGTFRPQLEMLEHRLAPGSLSGAMGPSADPDLAFLAGLAAAESQGAIQTTSPVLNFADFSLAQGSSTLTRTANGVSIQMTASGLPPGAYTFWWGVINPGTTNLVAGRAAGHVVGENGIANVAAQLRVGQTVGDPPAPGLEGTLQDGLRAQILLVARYHGPAIPGQIFEQTHTFQPELGFGPPPAGPDLRITIHPPPA